MTEPPEGHRTLVAAETDKPPLPFDVAKELNMQAGRLATAYGLLLTATTLSLGLGPIKDGLAPLGQAMEFQGFTTRTLASVVVPLAMLTGLIAAGASLAIGLLVVVNAMEPSLPPDVGVGKEGWDEFVQRKRLLCERAGHLLTQTIGALILVWSFAQMPALLGIQATTPAADIRPLILTWAIAFGGWALKRSSRGERVLPWVRSGVVL